MDSKFVIVIYFGLWDIVLNYFFLIYFDILTLRLNEN